MSKIYVDEIRPKTSGAQVTSPEVPAFRVYNKTSSGASFKTGHVTFTNIEFNQGNHWDNGNSVFVVPVSGVYFFSAGSLLSQSTSSNPLSAGASGSVFIEKSVDGGASWPTSSTRENRIACGYGYTAGSSHHPNGAMAVTAYLNAGDQVRLYTNDGFYYDTTPWNFFSGHFVG